MADTPHERKVREALAGFLERLRKPRRAAPVIIYPQPRVEEHPRERLEIPDYRCAFCGAVPEAGVSLPGENVVYFCSEHLPAGRRIAEKAWKHYERLRRLELLLEARKEYLNGVLERAGTERFCPFCGQQLCEEITHDGKLASFCPACDAEFQEASSEVE